MAEGQIMNVLCIFTVMTEILQQMNTANIRKQNQFRWFKYINSIKASMWIILDSFPYLNMYRCVENIYLFNLLKLQINN